MMDTHAKREAGCDTADVEITEEMIEAGEAIIFELRDDVMASTLAEKVYRAMVQAKTNPPSS